MSDAEVAPRSSFTRLEIGMLIVLVSTGSAGLIGLVTVLSADSKACAVGIGFGLAVLIFETGATVASPTASSWGSRSSGRCSD